MILLLDGYNDLPETRFSKSELQRAADVGIKYVWLFDHGRKTRPSRYAYDFSSLMDYAERAKRAGLKLYIQSAASTPDWYPKEWYLKNSEGITNDFTDPLLSHRISSYWNLEAEDSYYQYIQAVRGAISYATIVPCIGTSAGEYMFPATRFYDVPGMQGDWWFDDCAMRSWKQSGLSRQEWWVVERRKIIRRRLSWYSEVWTQFYSYHYDSYVLGVENILDDLQEYNPITILFSTWEGTSAQGKQFDTIVGAEGAAGIVENSKKAIEQGFVGVICGPLFYTSKMDDFVYQELAKAVKIWKGYYASQQQDGGLHH